MNELQKRDYQKPAAYDGLRATDEASKGVQKTPNRISLDFIESQIADVERRQPRTTPTMEICIITLKNGFVVIGKSAPADPNNYNQELGQKYAYEDAVRQMWPLFAFSLRDHMVGISYDATS
jgi:hypothetical protein